MQAHTQNLNEIVLTLQSEHRRISMDGKQNSS